MSRVHPTLTGPSTYYREPPSGYLLTRRTCGECGKPATEGTSIAFRGPHSINDRAPWINCDKVHPHWTCHECWWKQHPHIERMMRK